jgi:hypothetical protein
MNSVAHKSFGVDIGSGPVIKVHLRYRLTLFLVAG